MAANLIFGVFGLYMLLLRVLRFSWAWGWNVT